MVEGKELLWLRKVNGRELPRLKRDGVLRAEKWYRTDKSAESPIIICGNNNGSVRLALTSPRRCISDSPGD